MIPAVGVHVFPDETFRAAALPAFEEGIIDAAEWTLDVDVERGAEPLPAWCDAVLGAFSQAERLYGHAVFLHTMSVAEPPRERARFLEIVSHVAEQRPMRHVTAHYGFTATTRFARCAPLPTPRAASLVDETARRLAELGRAANCPYGLENLALAFSRDDIETQRAMLHALTARGAGLLLDAHNLDCQAENYGVDPRLLARGYPLEHVIELHVSGGRLSYPASDPRGRAFRRDTHDGGVPARVLELVTWLVPRCPNLEVVILEQLPHALRTGSQVDTWRADLATLSAVVREAANGSPPDSRDVGALRPCALLGDASLASVGRYEDALVDHLASRDAPEAVLAALVRDPACGPFLEQVRAFEPRAIEIATELVRTWSELRAS